MPTEMPVSFSNSSAAARSALTWDCLNVHISSDLESPDPEEPPQAVREVSESAVATAAETSRAFREIRIRMGPYLGFDRSEGRIALE